MATPRDTRLPITRKLKRNCLFLTLEPDHFNRTALPSFTLVNQKFRESFQSFHHVVLVIWMSVWRTLLFGLVTHKERVDHTSGPICQPKPRRRQACSAPASVARKRRCLKAEAPACAIPQCGACCAWPCKLHFLDPVSSKSLSVARKSQLHSPGLTKSAP